MRFVRRFAVLAPLVFTFFACSSAHEPPTVESTRAPIIHGTESDASQNAVVLIGFGAGGGWYDSCSGTLVAPNLVLTARHCVANLTFPDPSNPDACAATVTGDIDPAALLIYTGTTRTLDWISSPPQASGKQIFDDGSASLCGHDVALILLDTSITRLQDGGLAPVRLDAPPAVGDTFTAVGWGVTETTDNTGVRMQRTDIPITKVTTTDFEVGESICHGDSGGPALSSSTGAVIGVVSRGGGGKTGTGTGADGCIDPGVTNWYTGLWKFKTLILKAFAASTYDPWLEGDPDPSLSKFGAPCYTSPSCLSDLCIPNAVIGDAGSDAHTTGGPSAPGWCTQSCDTSNACPTGYDCTPYSGSVSDASVPDGGAPSTVCTKHVDAPAQAQSQDTKSSGGCAMTGEPASLGWPFALFGLVAGAALLRRRR